MWMMARGLRGLTCWLVFVVVGAAAPALAQLSWAQKSPITKPTARDEHAMAYDSARGVTVLFGGRNNAETWEWNGAEWTQRVVSGPSARYGHAMVYDSGRGVTVLFGGVVTGGGHLGDTWEWNGASWTQREVAGPSARGYVAMAYDTTRHVTVLFGGEDVNFYNGETWEWNGTAWTQRSPSAAPLERYAHFMAYDEARHVTVLFGGYNTTYKSDTWEWNGITWVQRVVTGPTARGYGAMTYDSVRGVCVLFGGFDGTNIVGQTWEWNGAWTQREISGPSAREYLAMAYDSARHATVLFGGYTGIDNDETWELGSPAPTASAVSVSVVDYGPDLRATVRYTSGSSMGTGSIDGGDVELRRQSGSTIAASLVSVQQVSDSVVDAVYRFAAPGGSWDSTDNDNYALWVLPSQVSDGLGNFVATGSLHTYSLWFNSPTALVTATTAENGGTFMDVKVLYRDNAGSPAGINSSTVATGDVELYGPSGFYLLGTLVQSVPLSNGQIEATYRFPARLGYWDWTDNGTYVLRLRTNRVRDMQGNPVISQTLRTYGLYFGTPNAVVSSTSVARGDATMRVTVVYRANGRLMSWGSIGAGDLQLNGPSGYTALATLVSQTYSSASNSYAVTYGFAAPGGTWDAADNGPYSVAVRANQVWDAAGYAVPPVTLQSYSLWFPSGLVGSGDGGCGDFDGDGEPATAADVAAFFACIGGDCCESCGSVDIDRDGEPGTDADIEAFFRVLAGAGC